MPTRCAPIPEIAAIGSSAETQLEVGEVLVGRDEYHIEQTLWSRYGEQHVAFRAAERRLAYHLRNQARRAADGHTFFPGRHSNGWVGGQETLEQTVRGPIKARTAVGGE